MIDDCTARVGLAFFLRSLILPLLFILLTLNPVSSGEALCAQVTLAWDSDSSPDVAGYRVHYGTATKNYSFNVDVGPQSTFTVTGLNEGTTYYFAATAYTATGSESNFSSEVTYSAGSVTSNDILWRRTAGAGEVGVWYMNGTSLTGTALIGALSDQSWQIVGTADFNGDGKADLLWRRNAGAGEIGVWYMNGTSLTGTALIGALSDQSWQIVGQ